MKLTKQIVALLLIVQGVATLYMWTVTLVGTLTAGGFAIFLAIDLLSFALVAYVYTHEEWGEAASRVWIIVGSVGLIILLLSSLYFS
jgi:succinate-acetate transporter protein